MNNRDPRNANSPKSKERPARGRYKQYQSRRNRKKNLMQQIALERVDILFERALRIFHDDPDLANRYVDIARRVCMVARVRLAARWRAYVCRGCKALIVPSVNCQVRLQSRPGKGSRVVKTCSKCGHVTRYYLRKASSATGEEPEEDN